MELMEVDDEEEGGALVELLLMVMEEVELGRGWEESSPATWPEVAGRRLGRLALLEKRKKKKEMRREKKEKGKEKKCKGKFI